MVGDSNTVVFNNLAFACPEFFSEPFVARAAFCRGVSAQNFADDAGAVHPVVAEALLAHLAAVGTPSSLWPSRRALALDAYERTHRLGAVRDRYRTPANDRLGSPVVVVMIGAADAKAVLETLPAGCDFALDDERFRPEAFTEGPVGPYVPAQLVHDLIAARTAPLSRALGTLHDAGFEHLYLHSVHPPPVEDRKYTRVRDGCSQAWLRYKVALAFNLRFRAVCAERGVRFLDMWDATTSGGVLDPRFEYDGDHLNREAAHLTVTALIRDLGSRVPPPKGSAPEARSRHG